MDQPQQQQQTPNLQARPAFFHATIEIKRAATGKTEVYHLTGTVPPEESKEQTP